MKKTVLALLALTTGAGHAAFASTPYVMAGQSCVSEFPINTLKGDSFAYQQNGYVNDSDVSVTTIPQVVYCPISYNAVFGQAVLIDSVAVDVIDGYSSGKVVPNQADLYCWVQEVNWDHNVWMSTVSAACGTDGGCSSPSGTFVGSDTLRWSTPPISNTNLYPISSAVVCNVPPSSTIGNYYVTVN
jgi:hypothetical protein